MQMRNGLYGKLQAKRDFIAISATREFLAVWETWLQGGIAASMHRLGDGWRQHFLRAPIWRFWLGADLCGETIIGAFMPSLDGVGRYFPLTVFARAGEAAVLPPPEFEPQVAWFTAAEDLLLATLDERTTFEATTAALAALAPPEATLPPDARRPARHLTDGTVVLDAGNDPFNAVFADARFAGHAGLYAGSTFWWTLGGEGFPPLALTQRRMPDPFLLTGMLTGDFRALSA